MWLNRSLICNCLNLARRKVLMLISSLNQSLTSFIKSFNSQNIKQHCYYFLIKLLDKKLKDFAIILIKSYQIVLSPHLGGACRFHPSCSEYGIQAFKAHGSLKGTFLTLKRILSCRPFGRSGFDPVPERVDFCGCNKHQINDGSIGTA